MPQENSINKNKSKVDSEAEFKLKITKASNADRVSRIMRRDFPHLLHLGNGVV